MVGRNERAAEAGEGVRCNVFLQFLLRSLVSRRPSGVAAVRVRPATAERSVAVSKRSLADRVYGNRYRPYRRPAQGRPSSVQITEAEICAAIRRRAAVVARDTLTDVRPEAWQDGGTAAVPRGWPAAAFSRVTSRRRFCGRTRDRQTSTQKCEAELRAAIGRRAVAVAIDGSRAGGAGPRGRTTATASVGRPDVSVRRWSLKPMHTANVAAHRQSAGHYNGLICDDRVRRMRWRD